MDAWIARKKIMVAQASGYTKEVSFLRSELFFVGVELFWMIEILFMITFSDFSRQSFETAVKMGYF